MTDSYENPLAWFGLIVLAVAVLEFLALVVLGVYAVKLRRRLAAAEQRLQELSQRSRSSQAALQRAARDPLTGVANRRTFDEAMAREWERAQRATAPLSLLLVDIDHFKRHNDEYGHQAGDECLKRVAAVLAAQARRQGDLVARYGGEEFAVLLPETGPEAAAAVAERLRVAVAAIVLPYKPSAGGHAVTVSVGVASVVPEASRRPAELIAASDQALYTAKAVGRNQVIVANALSAA
jgi:diguanylate cyclase (GGDEF)-like protein